MKSIPLQAMDPFWQLTSCRKGGGSFPKREDHHDENFLPRCLLHRGPSGGAKPQALWARLAHRNSLCPSVRFHFHLAESEPHKVSPVEHG